MEPIIAAITKKAASDIGDVAKESAKSFFSAVLHEPGEALSGWIGDVIRERRHANLIKILARAQDRLSAAGLSPRQVPLSVVSHSPLTRGFIP
jgi:hypothetical protein